MDRLGDPWYPHAPGTQPEADGLWRPQGPGGQDESPGLWRTPSPSPSPGVGPEDRPAFPRQVARSARTTHRADRGHVNEDLDLDEIDPHGHAQRRAAQQAARRANPNTRRRKALRVTAGVCAVLVLAISGMGTYAYEHLFGQVDTESLDSLTNRPAFSKADRFGNVPLNILLLGSQTRDGQHGLNLGNATKLGTNISDTVMLVHISAERKWATVVSIPRDLVVPRPQCEGRLDPTQTVPASAAAMFDLAMNLGGPTCAVATVEQMTGIRVDHFAEITFNAFQSLTDAVGGVTVCVPPPGINDPNYSGLVLSPGLHTVSGPESLAFVRDRHGLENGTDLNRIRMQQMFVSSLFNKLASAGTLGDPITLYKIANAVTSNLTVDTGLDSIDAMVGLAGSVQSLKSHYIQFLTVPYDYDPTNQNRVIPGDGFDQVWNDLRADTPLPGSNAAAAFGTNAPGGAPANGQAAPAQGTGATPAVPLSELQVEVYNGTDVPHLALNASQYLSAKGMNATVGRTPSLTARYTGVTSTEVLYPRGEGAQAQTLAGQIPGTVTTLQSSYVSGVTLVVGANAPTALVTAPGDSSTAGASPGSGSSSDSGSGSGSGSDSGTTVPTPVASISAETRSGDENICSDLPNTVTYGGHP